MIYLDNSTTSKPSEQAISRMLPFLTNYWGTPTAPHQKGQELIPFLTEFYQTIYTFLGAHENDQFVLTSSGAEAVNHVVSSVYRDITISTGKNQFLTSALDEAPSFMAIGQLEKSGCISKTIPVNHAGIVTVETLADTISPRTALVSLSWGNGLTGVIQPIEEIASLCKQRGIKLHLDATHVLGKLIINMKDVPVDYITFNGEQLHAPKGTGGLYVKQGIKCSPLIAGGGHLNVPGLAALACAATEATENLDLLGTETARLRNKLEDGIVSMNPKAMICFKNQERLPHCTTLLFPGVSNEALLFALNRKKVYASIGGGNFQQIGLLLASTGIEETLAHSAISFSLSRYTTEEEIDKAIQIVNETVSSLTFLSNKIFEEE